VPFIIEESVFANTKFHHKGDDYLGFSALMAMLVYFSYEMIFSGKIPFFRDLVTYFYPIKFSVAEAFKAGELPLWDSHMATGFPIIAGFQSAVFYPTSVAFYLLPFFSAIQFTFVFHYALAATGSYVLFRSWKSSVYVSLIGAILFTFGGTIVSLTNLLNHFQSAVWLPWVIFFWERAVGTRQWKDIATFSIVALCQILGGSPEIFLLSIGLVVLDTFRLYQEEQLRGLFPVAGILLGSGCIILGLGMLQFLPTAELIMQSRRDQPIPPYEAFSWSLHPASLIGFLLPTLEADASLSIGLRLLLTDGVPFLLSHYLSVIAVLAFCCWFHAARARERAVVLALVGGSLLLAFGRHTPVYPFLYEWIPVLRMVRFPEKYSYVTFALLIFIAARGLRQMDGDRKSHASWVAASSIFGVWFVIYLVFCIQPQLLADLVHSRNPSEAFLGPNPTTIAAILVNLEKQMAISLTLALLFGLNRFGVLRLTLLRPLLVVTVFLDLSSANKPLHFLRDKNVVQSAERILEKPPADPSRVFYYPPADNLHPSFMKVSGKLTYEKGTEIALNNLLPNAGMLYGFEYFQDLDALGRRSYSDFLNFINALPGDHRGRLLRALNVKYVVALHPLDVRGLKLIREFPEHYSRLYEVMDRVPRTYLASHPIYDQDPMSTLRRMSSESFDPLTDVVVNASTLVAPKLSLRGGAKITTYQNNRVQIDAQLSESGILILADAFYPGWKAFVDGKEQNILRANYLFRGVELPAGAHKIEFVYDPLSFRVGLAISLLTVMFLVAVPSLRAIRRGRLVEHAPSALSQQPARGPVI
jgi:hypothetical protein